MVLSVTMGCPSKPDTSQQEGRGGVKPGAGGAGLLGSGQARVSVGDRVPMDPPLLRLGSVVRVQAMVSV